MVDGVKIDVGSHVYELGVPVLAVAHPAPKAMKSLNAFGTTDEEISAVLKPVVFDDCKAEANWNMKNFIADQIELVKKQVGNKKVLLALSGGVDSSVVAALLLKAIGDQLYCVHVNHGLLRKGEPEPVSYTHLDVYKRQSLYCQNADRAVSFASTNSLTKTGAFSK